MNRREVLINPAVLAWAFGLGVFLAVTGAAAVAPPDPGTQLVVAGGLLGVVVPVVYLVLDADDVARNDVSSRLHLPYFIVVTTTSVLTAAFVPLSETGVAGIVLRGLAFLAPFAVISWITILIGRDAGPETVPLD